MIFGAVSQVIKTQFGSEYTQWKCWHPLSGKENAKHSLPHLENERQRSIKDFWSSKSGNENATW